MKKNNQRILVITGPTAVGKSGFAEKLADSLPIEIINADVGQFYTPLTIGTAKPAWKTSSIPHHLFDILDRPENITAVDYRCRVQQLLPEIWSRGNIPVIVGGSTFYVQSLFFEQPSIGPHAPAISGTWQDLQAIDPERAVKIHKNDYYRINRALSIWHTAGIKPSDCKARYNPIAAAELVIFNKPNNELHEQINQRVHTMLNQGWLEEIACLRNTPWVPFLKNKKIIGYEELLENNDLQYQNISPQIIDRIQQRTRAYAKRQNTFFRMLNRKLVQEPLSAQKSSVRCHLVDLTLINHDLYIKQLSQQFLPE